MGVIKTITANCKDCYKCVRYCPMKAIRVAGGHAEIIDELCVGCGTCVRMCPQGAKQVTDSKGAVRELLASGAQVILSVAPSFVASFDNASPASFAAAARKLGFSEVFETAEAAEHVALRSLEMVDACTSPAIATSCPVVVNLVERYYHHLLDHLIPVASPMVAHGRMIKSCKGPEVKVVFAGPCIAKKDEAGRAEVSGAIDAVLTFDELSDMFGQAGIDPADTTGAAGVSSGHCPGRARLFPIEGGMMATAGVSTDLIGGPDLCVTGMDNVIALLDNLQSQIGVRLVEIMACPGGCIEGPGASSEIDAWSKKRMVMEYAQQATVGLADGSLPSPSPPLLQVGFARREVDLPEPTEEDIRAILARTDKLSPSDELNCGACGYNSCREKAIAVFRGLAEVEMCIPYMRERAESMSNLIISTTPNGIVVVDRDLKIVSVNPAFEQVFGVKADDCLGRDVSTLLDPTPFRQVFETRELSRTGEAHLDGSLMTSQLLFYVSVRDVVVALVNDITTDYNRGRAIQKAREETLEKAGRVIDRQMRVAQEIAGLLGETTAETKLLLTQLIRQMQDEELDE
ncbi:MAG: [Fe-Fe] hydrogenase large subunit C-terminal domain-containing protein [Bacillota bacterium]